jgi:hypothetical protein
LVAKQISLVCEMDNATKSEKLFEAICKRLHYEVTKIDTNSKEGLQTPDFVVKTPNFSLIAEVKELTPNPDDQRQIREMKEQNATLGGSVIGARVRRAIRSASDQLERFEDRQIPLVIVLYDNVRTGDGRASYPMFYTEMHHIDAAMYGNLVVTVQFGGQEPRIPDRAGGGRTLTETEKNYISAVAVISDWDDETLHIYHNYFAKVPLSSSGFNDLKCIHFLKRGIPWSQPWKWEKKGSETLPNATATP